ncbi:MAG: hypothetical protein WDZ64_00070, partial [Parcubacteria group bacterium]
VDHELIEIEGRFKEKLGTRVRIEGREDGGKLTIDFFNKDDLRAILERIVSEEISNARLGGDSAMPFEEVVPLTEEEKIMAEDKPKAEEDDESLYSISNFSI